MMVVRRDQKLPLICVLSGRPARRYVQGYQTMPMPTVRLKPVRMTAEHVWLEGAAKEYLAQIFEGRAPGSGS